MALEHLSVGEIAVILPGATAVFRRHKIDFCCKGDALLAGKRNAADWTSPRSRRNSTPWSLPAFMRPRKPRI